MANFAEQLQVIRKEKGITQDALAGRMNVSRTTVSRWETGRMLPDIETLKLLSMVLNYNFFQTDDLMKFDSAREGAASLKDNENPDKKKTKKTKRILKASLSLVIVAFLLAAGIVIFRMNSASENNEDVIQYSREWYRMNDKDDSGGKMAFVRIVPRQNPAELVWNEEYSDNLAWIWFFDMREENGVRFETEEITISFFHGDGTVRIDEYDLSAMIKGNGTNVFENGQPLSWGSALPIQDLEASGILIRGYDEFGNEREFHGYQEFSKENLDELLNLHGQV